MHILYQQNRTDCSFELVCLTISSIILSVEKRRQISSGMGFCNFRASPLRHERRIFIIFVAERLFFGTIAAELQEKHLRYPE